jgi:hypothetical protein
MHKKVFLHFRISCQTRSYPDVHWRARLLAFVRKGKLPGGGFQCKSDTNLSSKRGVYHGAGCGAKLPSLFRQTRHTREVIQTPREVDPRNSSSFCHADNGIETLLISTVGPPPLPLGLPAPSRLPPRGMASELTPAEPRSASRLYQQRPFADDARALAHHPCIASDDRTTRYDRPLIQPARKASGARSLYPARCCARARVASLKSKKQSTIAVRKTARVSAELDRQINIGFASSKVFNYPFRSWPAKSLVRWCFMALRIAKHVS